MGETPYVSVSPWPNVKPEKYSEKVLETISFYEKIETDIKNIIKATKMSPKKAVIYVFPPELEKCLDLPSYLKRNLNLEAVVYATNDPNKFDPKDKSKSTRMGRPGIHLE